MAVSCHKVTFPCIRVSCKTIYVNETCDGGSSVDETAGLILFARCLCCLTNKLILEVLF